MLMVMDAANGGNAAAASITMLIAGTAARQQERPGRARAGVTWRVASESGGLGCNHGSSFRAQRPLLTHLVELGRSRPPMLSKMGT